MIRISQFKKRRASLSVNKVNLKGKSILIRVDFNLPLKGKRILDNYRIKESLDTLKLVKKKAGRIVLVTHLGRPEGKYVSGLSVKPLARELEKLWKQKVTLLPYEKKPERIIIPAKGIFMWENIRFWKGEEKNDKELAKTLASGHDIFINEAFSVCHRAHASVVGVTKHLPSYAGLRLGEEARSIYQLMTKKKSPSVAVVGGAKIETKIPVLRTLGRHYERILLGGLVAIEWETNKRKYSGETGWTRKLELPSGYTDKRKCDINKETARHYAEIIRGAKKILWNGPMGKFEDKRYRKGSETIAGAVSKNTRALRVSGGGETVTLLNEMKLKKRSGFVSTGGGAMLEYIAYGNLPGLTPLIY